MEILLTSDVVVFNEVTSCRLCLTPNNFNRQIEKYTSKTGLVIRGNRYISYEELPNYRQILNTFLFSLASGNFTRQKGGRLKMDQEGAKRPPHPDINIQGMIGMISRQKMSDINWDYTCIRFQTKLMIKVMLAF